MKRGIIVTVIISLLIISLVSVAYAGLFDRFLGKGKLQCTQGQILINGKCVKLEKPLISKPLIRSSGEIYAQSKCNNIDGDLDYDGVEDTVDQCPFTPYTMSILNLVQGDPFEYLLFRGAKVTLTDFTISTEGEALAHVTVEKLSTGQIARASIGASTRLALGGVIFGLDGKLYLREFRWLSNPDGIVSRGYALILATAPVNIDTGCNPEGERVFP